MEKANTPQTKAHQTAFRDAMEISHSSSMSWENQVWEEKQQRRGSSITESSPRPNTPPPASEEGNTSDVSMVDDGLTQHDLDVMAKEEREEDMETDAPANSITSTPLKELPMWEGPEAKDTAVRDDQFSQMSQESTDQNPPHDSDLNEDELLGTITNIFAPGGHSDDSIALTIPLGEDNL